MTKSDFESIVRDQQSIVYSIAYHYFNDVASAEEIAQDVFLQLYKNLQSIRSPDHLRSWLRRTTAHRCIDALRRRQTRREVPLEETGHITAEYLESDPLLHGQLQRLIASLPEKPRMVLVLKYSEDMDAEDIASLMNIPVATVRSHLQRALKLIRDKASRQIASLEI